ncbi:hypothetical protein FHS15_001608 [Paenibacillus castaneae]|nr:hypothetical protein [Paenibacillus castaneae]
MMSLPEVVDGHPFLRLFTYDFILFINKEWRISECTESSGKRGITIKEASYG